MFLKLLVSLFSFIILAKNIVYSIYEFNINKNTLGAICVSLFSFISILTINIILFFIRF